MIKILIIDDSDIIRSLLSDFLVDQGYEVTCATDGQIGIDTALEQDFDVIFCDIHMPKRNGYQVLTKVLSEKQNANFVMTDSLPDELAEKAQNAGAYCILTKPFDLDEVNDLIQEIVQNVNKNEFTK